MSEALILIVALLLDKVETGLHLDLIINHQGILSIHIEYLPACVVGGYLRCENSGMLHFHEESLARISDCHVQ